MEVCSAVVSRLGLDCHTQVLLRLLLCVLQQLEEFAFDFLAGNGDFLDIRNFLFPDLRPDASTLTKEEALKLVNLHALNYTQ